MTYAAFSYTSNSHRQKDTGDFPLVSKRGPPKRSPRAPIARLEST